MPDDPATADEEFSDLEVTELLAARPKFEALAFKSYLEMALWLLPELQPRTHENEEKHILFEWQWQVSNHICNNVFNVKEDPCLLQVIAANGSGKDTYCIAPLAVWMASCKIRSRTIITSGSDRQLIGQTEPYIVRWCQLLNEATSGQFFRIRKKHIINLQTGSEIRMFATDDALKAEGYHPFPDSPGRDVCLIMNEAKAIKDEIFTGLARCTYKYWVEVSSPGASSGHFYNTNRKAQTLFLPRVPGKHSFIRVTSFQCGDLLTAKAARLKEEVGEDDPLYRSAVLAEFTSAEETTVINRILVDNNTKQPPEHKRQKDGNHIRAGLDFSLSVGGDECGGYIVDGNKVLDKIFFRDKNAISVANKLVEWLDSWKAKAGLVPDNVNGDEGGLGRAIIDIMVTKGWPIRRVRNESAAHRPDRYRNRGIEMYLNIKRHLEHKTIILPDDEKLRDQLSGRYYCKPSSTGIMGLESKIDAKLRGHGSPDRADAYVLCYANVRPEDFMEGKQVEPAVNRVTTSQEKFEAEMKYLFGNNQLVETSPELQPNAYLNLNSFIRNKSSKQRLTFYNENSRLRRG